MISDLRAELALIRSWQAALERAINAEDKLRELADAADAALIALRSCEAVDRALQREPEAGREKVLEALRHLDSVVCAILHGM